VPLIPLYGCTRTASPRNAGRRPPYIRQLCERGGMPSARMSGRTVQSRQRLCCSTVPISHVKHICLWHYWVGSDVLFFPFLLQVIIMHRVRRTMNFDNQHTYPSFVTISSTESGLMTAHSSYIHLHTYSYVLLCAISQGKSLRRFRFRRANEMSRVLQFLN